MNPSDPPIRVFVVDDHPMVRSGLAATIRGEPGLALAGESGDGEHALAAIPAAAPDVVLMDLAMPRRDGVSVIAALRPTMPSTRFVVLTSSVDHADVRRAIDAGAAGYVGKTASAAELVAMIRSAHAGRRVLSPEATDALVAARQGLEPGADLTPRERELLALMARGLNNQEIAAELGISLPTVKFHVTNVLAKLGVDNRTEAVLKALKLKLVAGP
jgi:NarL family two-component system response regulator LiaR